MIVRRRPTRIVPAVLAATLVAAALLPLLGAGCTERPADHHAAVIKTPFTNTTAVVQFSFLLKGQSRPLPECDQSPPQCQPCAERPELSVQPPAVSVSS
mgnify:CR=1 FL=1